MLRARLTLVEGSVAAEASPAAEAVGCLSEEARGVCEVPEAIVLSKRRRRMGIEGGDG